MVHFVLIYNRQTGEVQIPAEFAEGHAREAIKRRFIEERKYDNSQDIEVVVLSAMSIEDLQATHARYFQSIRELASGQQ